MTDPRISGRGNLESSRVLGWGVVISGLRLTNWRVERPQYSKFQLSDVLVRSTEYTDVPTMIMLHSRANRGLNNGHRNTK